MDDTSHGRNTVVGASCLASTDGERSRKNPRESRVDRISELPDLVLVHILSFLPMDAAIRTGVLSKRFAYKWASTPNLVFDQDSEWEIDDFITFVNRALLLHDPNCKVQKFTIYMDCMDQVIENSLQEDCVTLWLRFATRKGVEKLNLGFNDEEDPLQLWESRYDSYRYLLPQFIFRHSSFRKLATRFCNFVTYGVVSWAWLKSLSIGYAELNEETIRNILMGSPALECLEFHRCHGFARINICSESLKKLSILEPWAPNDAEGETVLEVSAPNIRSLELSGNWEKMCRLLDMSSLVNAKLDIQMMHQDRNFQYFSEDYSNMLREILKQLSHVENLTVGTWCLEVLSVLEMKSMPSPLSKHRYLILNTLPKKWDLPGIASLLKSSPDLEKLHIDVNPLNVLKFWEYQVFNNYYKYGDDHGESFWESEEKSFKCLLQNLKIIKIVGFDPGYCNIQFAIAFIEFLLKNAQVLEKMVINVRKVKRQTSYAAQELPVVQKLLSFTRASPRAAVLFSK